jgi:hypothetical protein
MAHELLDRRHWLQEHGFRENLFHPESWNAETDVHAIRCFIHPKNYESLVGTLKNPECHFVCSPPGGGKSSLRRAIKAQLDSSLLPRILTVEYLVDGYDEIADTWEHCHRIVALVNRALQRAGKAAVSEVKPASREELFETMIHGCREAGFEAVYILVDNVTGYETGSQSVEEQFKRVSGLIRNYSLLSMGLRGVVFKFFLPTEMSPIVDGLYQNKLLKSLEIEWSRSLLMDILQQRLIVSCLEDKLGRSEFILSTFEEMFEPAISSQVVDTILDSGCRARSPRAMWQLGYYLLEVHFRNGGVLRRYDELINDLDLRRALDASGKITAKSQEALGSSQVPAPARKTVFVSHTWAPEDKKFSDALVGALRRKDLDVWYDEESLGIGDSLPDKIQQIIGRCDHAIVVLSPDYFSRSWTRRELDLLVDREIADQRNLVVPILHHISIEDVRKANRHMSFRLAISSNMRLDRLVNKLVQAMQ